MSQRPAHRTHSIHPRQWKATSRHEQPDPVMTNLDLVCPSSSGARMQIHYTNRAHTHQTHGGVFKTVMWERYGDHSDIFLQ